MRRIMHRPIQASRCSTCRSHPSSWFQLAKMRLTTSTRPLASGEQKTRSCRATPRVECAERPPIARESKCQFSPRLELVRSDEISHPAATAGEKHSCTRGAVFETRRACLRRFVGGTFPFAKTHKHLDTRLSEHARSHIAARLQAAGPSHQGPHDWIERRGSMPRVILRSDT